MTIFKPTLFDGFIGLFLSIRVYNDLYTLILQYIPLPILCIIVMFTWNYPVVLYFSKKRLSIGIGWKEKSN